MLGPDQEPQRPKFPLADREPGPRPPGRRSRRVSAAQKVHDDVVAVWLRRRLTQPRGDPDVQRPRRALFDVGTDLLVADRYPMTGQPPRHLHGRVALTPEAPREPLPRGGCRGGG